MSDNGQRGGLLAFLGIYETPSNEGRRGHDKG